MKNVWKIIGTIALVVIVLLVCFGGAAMLTFGRVRAVGMMRPIGGLGMMGGFPHLGWVIPLILFVLVVAGIIAFIVWVVQKESKPSSPTTSTSGETPFDILKMRYAKGEITKEQFDAMKKDLGIAEI